MYELIGKTHNDIDGSYCWGFLNFEKVEYGTRGEICTYVCSQCGMHIRNLERQNYSNPTNQYDNDNNPFSIG